MLYNRHKYFCPLRRVIKKTEGGHPLEPIDKVLLTLRFYASGNFLQVIGDIVAVNKATVLQAVFFTGEAI